MPAIALGGTLPVLMRAGGRLYAANTAGAIAGALLSAFVLIPLLGVQGSAYAAAALLLRGPVAHSKPVPGDAAHDRIVVALYAVAGGIALGYEVIWSQASGQFISTRSFAFSIVLATYLFGLAAGSGQRNRRSRWPDSLRAREIGYRARSSLHRRRCCR